MPEKEQKEFTFMSEQLKKKPFYKRKGFIKGLSVSALAILFGAVAGFTFSVVQPWAQKQFGQPDDPAQIVIVQEETETETLPPSTESETETVQTEAATPVPETVIEKKELEITDYKMLYKKMSEVAEGVTPSIVIVTGESSNLDWFNEVIENHVQTSGLIIAENQHEYFVLTEKQVIEGAERIIVTFSNGVTAEASLQKQDSVTGMAVVRVPKNALDSATKKDVIIAEVGNSASVKQGDPVIALGSPIGNSSSMSFGMITSVVQTSVVDEEYTVLTTDIIGSEQGSGILINLDGKILGIIAQRFATDSKQITITCLATSDIQELITKLANNREWTYMGIIGKEINQNISKDFEMPEGIYVKGVDEDSPAKYYGVVSADIITSIDGKEISTMDEYVEELQSHKADDIIRLDIKRRALEGYADMEITIQLGRG